MEGVAIRSGGLRIKDVIEAIRASSVTFFDQFKFKSV